MLWRVKDFKGLKSAEIDIRVGKATVLTGVNSSGKSSVIQSLLLTAQSVQGENQTVLNGPLVRLGDAQDLVRDGSESGAVEVTVGLEGILSEDGSVEDAIEAVIELVPAEDRSSLRTRRVQIGSPGLNEDWFHMGRENSRASDVDLAMQFTQDIGPRDVLHLKSLLESDRRQLRTYVVMKGLQPVAVIQLMKPEDVERRYRALLDSLLTGQETSVTNEASAATARIGGTAFIREFVRLISASDEGHGSLPPGLSEARTGNPYAFERGWRRLGTGERQELIDRAVKARRGRPYVLVPLRPQLRGRGLGVGLLESRLIDLLGRTLDALNSLSATLYSIADRVQYLGPLRDEPRVVWNHWNELARGLPVGTRGEYSAAVLSRSNSSLIQYRPPGSGQVIAPLSQAVNEWLMYLDIGDAVAARSQGKLGVGLDLRVNGQIRDLTSVGVGVSQSLPLLVGLLTAPYGSIFIVEQPELHLHPSVQARLADFMLNARPDLTLIVETHSESFITRIRRRAAEGQIDVDDIDITFIEPSNGGSLARRLEISRFGDLSEWPHGFLSAAEEDTRAILKANIERSAEAANAK